MSKGSAQRPRDVSKEAFDQSFDRIFKREEIPPWTDEEKAKLKEVLDQVVTPRCPDCGKTILRPDDVHTCSSQVKIISVKCDGTK